MKILQIFGAVVAVHLLAFILIFASPGCQSGPRNVPTPDATMPAGSGPAVAPVSYNGINATPQPVDLGTAPAYAPAGSAYGHNAPTRPGSPAAAAVSPARAPDDVAAVTMYTVVRGDSLWSVAQRNHLTVAELSKANNFSPSTVLKPGKRLLIPAKAGAAPAALASSAATAAGSMAEKSPAAAGAEVVRHTVQSGESLGVIARRYRVSVGEIAAANNIADPSKVRAGQQLIIPGYKGAVTRSTPAARPASVSKPTSTPTAVPTPAPSAPTAVPATSPDSPHFEITAPPPGQDLDAGLKETTTEVPTIKVEDPDQNK